MERVKQEVNCAAKQELLGERSLFDGLQQLRGLPFCHQCKVSVELMEEKDVKASHSVAFIEGRRPLLIETLECLEVASVDWCAERQRHS